jgi:hypothetical protein
MTWRQLIELRTRDFEEPSAREKVKKTEVPWVKKMACKKSRLVKLRRVMRH